MYFSMFDVRIISYRRETALSRVVGSTDKVYRKTQFSGLSRTEMNRSTQSLAALLSYSHDVICHSTIIAWQVAFRHSAGAGEAVNYFPNGRSPTKKSKNNLFKIGDSESIGDVTYVLSSRLAAEFEFSPLRVNGTKLLTSQQSEYPF